MGRFKEEDPTGKDEALFNNSGKSDPSKHHEINSQENPEQVDVAKTDLDKQEKETDFVHPPFP